MRLGRILILIFGLAMLVGIGQAYLFYDDFNSYTYTTDAGFMSNYTNISFPYSHDAFIFYSGDTYFNLKDEGLYLLNESKIVASTAQTRTLGFMVKKDSLFYYACGYPSPTLDFLIYTNGTAGYKMSYRPSGATLYRCIDNITKPISNYVEGCSGVAIASSSNFTQENFDVSSGACMFPYVTYPTVYTLLSDTPIAVSMDTSGYISLYWNNKLVMSVKDGYPFYTNGSLGFGAITFYLSNTNIIMDNLYLDNATYTPVVASNFYPVSYPEYIPYNFTLEEKMNGTLANWVGLNQVFALDFSFLTKAGYMNEYTETSCPVRLFGEWDAFQGRTDNYPEILVKATDANSANKCVRRLEYSQLQSYWNAPTGILGAVLCMSPEHCLITWQTKENNSINFTQPITDAWASSGAWRSAYKVIDTNNKWFYTSVNYLCSSPANLTFAIEYMDRYACNVPSTQINTFYYNLTNIGINPDTNESCDVQLNASCWNGSRGIPAPTPLPCTGAFCNPPPFDACGNGVCNTGENFTNCPADCPRIDPFNEGEVGSLTSALMSPAFIGIIICLALAMLGAVYGGQLIGAMGFIGAFFFMTWWGLFPLWVGMGVIVLASFVTVYMVRDIFTGE